jgi:hypothetical protein
MDKDYREYIQQSNNDDVNIRLQNLPKLAEGIKKGDILKPNRKEEYVNNHIHTFYSFSSYSPVKAVLEACSADLVTCGIVDHDTVSGVEEFKEAGKIIGIATTIGMECRVDFSKTPLRERRINNPDQKDLAYILLHGIPHTQIKKVETFIQPYRKERYKRNQLMVDKMNEMTKPFGIFLDFEKDVITISKYNEGGSITETYIICTCQKIVSKYGKGVALIEFLKEKTGLEVSANNEKYLMDIDNEYYIYDVVAALKSDTSFFYIDATTECPDVKDFTNLAEKMFVISAYVYFGDAKDLMTGDKKVQKFENEFFRRAFCFT